MRRVERVLIDEWIRAEAAGERWFPHEYLYRVLLDGRLKAHYQIDVKDSWLVAAAERHLQIFVPGWEDSTLGNVFAARCLDGRLKRPDTVKRRHRNHDGAVHLGTQAASAKTPIGFSKSAAASPATSRSAWCRCCIRTCISPACRSGRTSARSATPPRATAPTRAPVPNEKITWGKLGVETPRFVIESDATIVAPLIFAKVLGH